MSDEVHMISKLVATIAHSEGLSEPRVAEVARHLQEVGLVSSDRVSGALPSMADAANLLIAVNATPVAKEAADAVRWYGGMISYMPAPDPARLGKSGAERRVLNELAFVADTEATFGEVLRALLTLAARGTLRRLLHDLGLIHVASPIPREERGIFALERLEPKQRDWVRAAVTAGEPSALAEVREALRGELDEFIRLGAVSLLVRFCRPRPGGLVEIRRGGCNHDGRPEGGRELLTATFRLDLEDDRVAAQGEHFHQLLYLTRSEVGTIDQRGLLAVGEALAGIGGGLGAPTDGR
jgi:hypothetical protein